MEVKIKRIDKSLPVPEYKSNGAAGFDVYSREKITVKPGEIRYIPLNIALEIPEGTWIMLLPRSSTHKLGITAANSVGVGDSDFKGDSDEYHFAAMNISGKEITIEKGVRIAQMILMTCHRARLIEVESLNGKNRGSFGSTGYK